ncbi:MAG TPA: efflux RND transporter periplasmic adaptor subunit [Gammaproteobacteria bacterium]|nr:efflux RND transporter periplasmic adaptor subunit [Gammaproteobacteria bacterium]
MTDLIVRGRRASAGPLALLFALCCTFVLPAIAADGAPPAPPPPTVTVAQPLLKRITEWDEYTGRFVAKQRVEVRARVSGFLDSVHFAEGQLVDAGQLLFVIDQRPFAAQVERARADLARAETQLKLAQLEFERGQRLEKSRAMSRETLEERRAERDSAQAQVAAAQAVLRAAELDLGFTEVRAPMAGRVSDIRIDVGNVISGGTADSTLLTTIVSLDPIELEIEASESEFMRYTRLDSEGRRTSSRNVQNPVEARLIDEEGWPHRGRMTFVDNELDPVTGTMLGRATFPNPDHVLLPGMFARARLYGEGEHEAILIPDAAIVADQATKLVMVVKPDKLVEARPVVLGGLYEGLRIVRSGLAAGDRIIVNGVQRARPGQPVTPMTADAAASAAAAATGH